MDDARQSYDLILRVWQAAHGILRIGEVTSDHRELGRAMNVIGKSEDNNGIRVVLVTLSDVQRICTERVRSITTVQLCYASKSNLGSGTKNIMGSFPAHPAVFKIELARCSRKH